MKELPDITKLHRTIEFSINDGISSNICIMYYDNNNNLIFKFNSDKQMYNFCAKENLTQSLIDCEYNYKLLQEAIKKINLKVFE